MPKVHKSAMNLKIVFFPPILGLPGAPFSVPLFRAEIPLVI